MRLPASRSAPFAETNGRMDTPLDATDRVSRATKARDRRLKALTATAKSRRASRQAAGFAAPDIDGKGRFPEAGERAHCPPEGSRGWGPKPEDCSRGASVRRVGPIEQAYLRRGLACLRLIREGWRDLVRPVEKFDFRRGYKFS